MIPQIYKNSVTETLKFPTIFAPNSKKSDDEANCFLYDRNGVFVKVNKVTKNWVSKESRIDISPSRRMTCKFKVNRVQYCFGNIILADEVSIHIRVEKLAEKQLLGWQDTKETTANRGNVEVQVNRELREFIEDIAIRNCHTLSQLKIVSDTVRIPCNEKGDINEKGQNAFFIDQHQFKPSGSHDLLNICGWHTEDNEPQESSFFRLAVISATMTKLGKIMRQAIFCKPNNDMSLVIVGKLSRLADDRHPIQLYDSPPQQQQVPELR